MIRLVLLLLSSASLFVSSGSVCDTQSKVQQAGYRDRLFCEGDCNSQTVSYDSLSTDLSSDGSSLDTASGVYKVVTGGLYMISWSASIHNGILKFYVDGKEYDYDDDSYQRGQQTLTKMIRLCPGQTVKLGVNPVCTDMGCPSYMYDISSVQLYVSLVQQQD